MADTISIKKRSANMRAIRSTGMKPEMSVRRAVFSLGYRYRLHGKDLPGKPDLVFRSKRKAIFVHGCFWHQHDGCRGGRIPRSNLKYWQAKLARNVERDAGHLRQLKGAGWKVLIIWECETTDMDRLNRRLSRFLG